MFLESNRFAKALPGLGWSVDRDLPSDGQLVRPSKVQAACLSEASCGSTSAPISDVSGRGGHGLRRHVCLDVFGLQRHVSEEVSAERASREAAVEQLQRQIDHLEATVSIMATTLEAALRVDIDQRCLERLRSVSASEVRIAETEANLSAELAAQDARYVKAEAAISDLDTTLSQRLDRSVQVQAAALQAAVEASDSAHLYVADLLDDRLGAYQSVRETQHGEMEAKQQLVEEPPAPHAESEFAIAGAESALRQRVADQSHGCVPAEHAAQEEQGMKVDSKIGVVGTGLPQYVADLLDERLAQVQVANEARHSKVEAEVDRLSNSIQEQATLWSVRRSECNFAIAGSAPALRHHVVDQIQEAEALRLEEEARLDLEMVIGLTQELTREHSGL